MAEAFSDGVYRVAFEAPPADGQDIIRGSALAVLRRGQIVGADDAGMGIEGSYSFDVADGLGRAVVRLLLPPSAELVTGLRAGSQESVIEVAFPVQASSGTREGVAVVDLAGVSLKVEIVHVAPLPD